MSVKIRLARGGSKKKDLSIKLWLQTVECHGMEGFWKN